MTINGVTFSDVGNGKISVSGTATKSTTLILHSRTAGERVYLPVGTYTISGSEGQTNCPVYYHFYDSQEGDTNSYFMQTFTSLNYPTRTITLEKGCYFGAYILVNSGNTADGILFPQIEIGTVATAYEPYKAETLIAELPETVYGGSIDWANGVLTVNSECLTLTGNETIGLSGTTSIYIDAIMENALDKADGYCSHAVIGKTIEAEGEMMLGRASTNYPNGTKSIYWWKILSILGISTVDEFKEWLKAQAAAGKPVMIVYPLVTPYTIQLTPQQLKTFKGTNYIWTNCGPTKATFNLTPEITDENSCKIVKRTGTFTSAHSIEGLAIHPISHMKPIQAGEGTPSPDNVRAISGFDGLGIERTGKNLYGGGDITFTGTKPRIFPANLPAGTYTISAEVESDAPNTYARVSFYQGGENGANVFANINHGARNSSTITTTATINRLIFYSNTLAANSEGYTATWTNIQLERGQTATEYEPYDGDTISIEFPETVYGGTYDWATGELTVDKAKIVFDGVNNKASSISLHANGKYYAVLKLPQSSVRTLDKLDNPLSDKFIAKGSVVEGGCYIAGSGYKSLVITLTDQTLTTVEAINAWLVNNPTTFVYDLANPYTIQLPPQQLKTTNGTNIVHSSAQKTEAIFNLTPQMPNKSAFKSGTTEEWENDSYVPNAGELIIYTDTTPAGVKVGDGIHTATELTFINFVNDYTQYFYCGSSTVVVGEEGSANR